MSSVIGTFEGMSPAPSPSRPFRIALALTLLLPACAQTTHDHAGAPGSTHAAAPAPTITGSEWRCSRLGNVTPPADCMPTFMLGTDGKASGFAGVNRWFGTCTANGASLAFGPLVATRMAGPPAKMELEQQYLRVIATATQWTIADGTLRLSDGTSVVAEFEPMPPAAPDAKH
jgi:heat shock protein HslJ